MPGNLTLSYFARHLHTRFRVAALQDYELELAEITDHSNSQLEQFSLIFTGIPSPWLPQGSYKLAHQQIGECEMFLVPVGPDNARMRYQAVFSRPLQKQAGNNLV
jgi:hypothetical protein